MSQTESDFAASTGAVVPAVSGLKSLPVELMMDPDVERYCPQCGFLVVGKASRKQCPDCLAWLDGVTAEKLQNADPAWVREISWGGLMISMAVPLYVIGAVVGPMLAAAGVWLLTQREPGAPERHVLLRLAARWASLGAVMMGILTLIAGVMPAGAIHSMETGALVCWIFLTAAMAVAGGFYAWELARRIPNEGLANQFWNFVCFFPPFLGFVLICLVYDLSVFYVAFMSTLPVIFGMVVMMVWVTVIWGRLFRELRHAARAWDGSAVRAARAASRRKTAETSASGSSGSLPP